MSDAPKPIVRLPRFPFFGHRTLAEVDETERLELMESAGMITKEEAVRLGVLRQKQLRVMRECGLL